MLDSIIQFSVKHKLVIVLFVLVIIVFGSFSLSKLSVGAVPDITNNQVQIITVSTNLSTQDVEQYITMPVELAMANLPGVAEIRSISKFGLSVVTIVFDENLGTYLPRQLIAEKIVEASENIPEGFGTPMMGPVTTGLGEIYQYILDVKPGYEDRYSIMDLRTIQDWIVKRQLSGIPGVVEVNTWGGYLKQYEISINPELLRSQGITLIEVFDALKSNNNITGGSYIEKNNQSYFIRGDGTVKSLDDIRRIVIKNRNGSPILIGDIAQVGFGYATRFGAITANGEGEKVMGQVMMLKGADSQQTIQAVKARVEEVQQSLPEGVYINPIVDRSELIRKTTLTIFENLLLGIVIVILIVMLILGNIRTALIIASVIPLSLLFTLSMMYLLKIDAN
ncbi:MAG: heavy metal efflux system protein, partial [Bacteroidota bacterium]|nr:heavy metal efflux system protein [Bacteroidota bacterium]